MTELHYTTYGSGPPLVMVHGLAGSQRWWRRNTKALSKHFKVYLIDLPGFGRRGAVRPLAELAASLPAWLEWAGLDCVRLVGHSMGGYIALHLAATTPERVAQLALINSVGMPVETSVPQMVRRLLLSAPHGSPTFIPTILTDGVRAGIPALLRLTAEIVKVDARPLLRAIQAPTLVLWGTRDILLPPRMGMQMARHIPNATFQFVPRAGHNAMADRPTMVNRYLLDFFQQETQGATRSKVSEIA
jgi:pimeloyl-ACP methyl ester carboxylesterase